ncbi:Cro/CI family transcriptional regulator [Shewanella sp.]|uniref:Cro/CI family transcriptional regulator n=1 Tax=Shewanella sp. TaxID=50422 RepID=UPI003F3273CF
MTKTQAINHFGSQKKLCEITGRAKATVSTWPEKLPRGVQFEIEVKTKGLLKADPELFISERAA